MNAICFAVAKADETRKRPRRPAVEREAPLDEHLAEPGSIGRHHQVACERHSERDADGNAVDRGDRRLRQPVQPVDQVADDAHLVQHQLRLTAGEAAPLLGRLGRAAGEIRAGREVAAGAGDQQRSVSRVVHDLDQHAIEVGPALRVERVLLLGPVERHGDEALVPFDERYVHQVSPGRVIAGNI